MLFRQHDKPGVPVKRQELIDAVTVRPGGGGLLHALLPPLLPPGQCQLPLALPHAAAAAATMLLPAWAARSFERNAT